jgi:hypothetical protein
VNTVEIQNVWPLRRVKRCQSCGVRFRYPCELDPDTGELFEVLPDWFVHNPGCPYDGCPF